MNKLHKLIKELDIRRYCRTQTDEDAKAMEYELSRRKSDLQYWAVNSSGYLLRVYTGQKPRLIELDRDLKRIRGALLGAYAGPRVKNLFEVSYTNTGKFDFADAINRPWLYWLYGIMHTRLDLLDAIRNRGPGAELETDEVQCEADSITKIVANELDELDKALWLIQGLQKLIPKAEKIAEKLKEEEGDDRTGIL